MSAPITLLVLATVCAVAQALPVKQQTTTTTTTATPESETPQHLPEHDLHYSRYLQEVVQALETDPEFKAKLDKAEQVDIRVSRGSVPVEPCSLFQTFHIVVLSPQSGQIAHELDYVHHNVRNELDEIKRREINRLRELATKQVNHIIIIIYVNKRKLFVGVCDKPITHSHMV